MKFFSFWKYLPFLILLTLSVAGLFTATDFLTAHQGINQADVAWMLVSCCLVFLMTPGLSFFYGGMVNRKNIISTMLQSFIATGVVSIIWVVIGFSLAFGDSFHGIIGHPLQYFFFQHIAQSAPLSLAPTIPLLLFALFQLKFAVIAPALVVGAVAERIKFKPYLLFMILFTLLIYAPIAHWTWSPEGFLNQLGVLDFAGGMVVHIPSGCAALVGALILKRRKSFIQKKDLQPANIPFVLLGTSLLWFGWFGFNAGSAMGANNLAAFAFATTNTATAAAGLGWIFFDLIQDRKPTAMGFCIGAVVGMVAITPAAGFVGIPQSLFIGFIASLLSNIAVHWRSKTTIDDTLDVFPCHGLGGISGMLLTGIFASIAINGSGKNGWAYGNFYLFLHQSLGMLIVVAYSLLMSWLIFKFVNLIYPLRVSDKEEDIGLDLSQHDEIYDPQEVKNPM